LIFFKKIRWKNFLSTGNSFTEIDYSKNNTTLIVGENGAGKSTMLDALSFVLYNKPFRKVNKPQLLNSINKKDLVVEIEFNIGSHMYKIIRGLKPAIFKVYQNNKLINQDAEIKDYQEVLEKQILKLNHKSFCQVVVLGSASFVPFMQLTAAARREVIEDLLDIQIFSTMNSLLKEKISVNNNKLLETEYQYDLTSEKIKMQKQNIDEHRKHNEEEIERKKVEIESSKSQADKLRNDIDLIQKHVDQLVSKIQDETKVRAKSKKILQMESKLESAMSKIDKDIVFFSEHDHCPTCTQTIGEGIKKDKITEKETKKGEILEALNTLSEDLDKVNGRINEIVEVQKNIIKHNSAIAGHHSTLNAIFAYVAKLNGEIELLLERKGNIIDENVKLNELKTELKELLSKQEELSVEKHYYEYAATLLKDTGIKTKIIKQYLPIMNKLINKYLAAMDFFVNFEINENFEETIRSRFRDEFSYANFSEGEKQKIDLALLFTWRQVAKLKNSSNTNLLILDEVFDSSLDSSSVELLMNLINEFSTDTNVFVISHKGDQLFDKFRSVIKFTKKGNFSVIEGK